jgi:hypothetical protein
MQNAQFLLTSTGVVFDINHQFFVHCIQEDITFAHKTNAHVY